MSLLNTIRTRIEQARTQRFQGLTKPPAPGSDGPQLDATPLGSFRLYKDSNWSSQSSTYNLGEYLPGSRHLLKQPISGDATWGSWRLPKGYCLTLCSGINSGRDRRPGLHDPNFANCGLTVDLIGTGETEFVNFSALGLNDALRMFFFRRVDTDKGAIELFNKVGFEGPRLTLFLSEWPMGPEQISFKNWWIDKRTSSIRWSTLNADQMVLLHTTKGFDFAGCKGWGTGMEISDCTKFDQFNDCITAFSWYVAEPVKEIIDPIKIDQVALQAPQSYSAKQSGENRTSQEQKSTVTLRREQTTQLTVTMETTTTIGFSMSVEASYSGLFASGSITMSVSRDLTKRDEKSQSTTITAGTEIAQEVVIPPNSRWEAEIIVEAGSLPPRNWTAKATRWYDVWVPDGVADPQCNGWFKRDEQIRGTIAGGFTSTVKQSVKATPL